MIAIVAAEAAMVVKIVSNSVGISSRLQFAACHKLVNSCKHTTSCCDQVQ
jgi:hypothetical protein